MVPWLFAPIALAHHPHDPINVVAVSPAFETDRTLFASRLPPQNWRPQEVVVSHDGGWNWQSSSIGMQPRFPGTCLALSPEFPTDRVGIYTTAGDGVYVTTDGGEHWAVSLPDTVIDACTVAIDATAPVLLVHEANGLLQRSVDLGATWDPVPGGASAVTVMKSFGAEVAFSAGNLLFTSADAGASFGAPIDVGGPIQDLAVAPGTVVLATAGGVRLSTDGGPFTLVSKPFPTTRVGISPGWPADPLLVNTGELYGPFVSDDAGETWFQTDPGIVLSPQSNVHFYSIVMTPRFTVDDLMAVNMWEGLFLTEDRGATWRESDTRMPGLVTALAMSPTYADDHTVLVGSYDSGMRVSRDDGETFTTENTGLHRASAYGLDMGIDADGQPVCLIAMKDQSRWGHPPFDQWERRAFVPEYPTVAALSPTFALDGIALIGHRTQGIIRTADAGATWTEVSGRQSAISTLVWSADGSVVLAGTVDGTLLRSTDHGVVWVTVDAPLDEFRVPVFAAASDTGFVVGGGTGLYTSPDGLGFDLVSEVPGVVNQVAAAPDGTLFAAIDGGSLYRSDNGVWTAIGPELTALGSPHEIEVSPTFDQDQTLFASIDELVFRSRDRGDHWETVDLSETRYEEDAGAVVESGDLSIVHVDDASTEAVVVIPRGQWVGLSFVGTGIAWLGSAGGGAADVELDGVVVATVDTAGGGGSQVEHYRVVDLPNALHELRILATSDEPVVVDAFDVTRVLPVLDGGVPDDTGDPIEAPPVSTDGDDGKKCGCDAAGGPGGAVVVGWIVVLAVRRRRGVA